MTYAVADSGYPIWWLNNVERNQLKDRFLYPMVDHINIFTTLKWYGLENCLGITIVVIYDRRMFIWFVTVTGDNIYTTNIFQLNAQKDG